MAAKVKSQEEPRQTTRFVAPVTVFVIGLAALWFAAVRESDKDWLQFLAGHFGIALIIAAIVGLAYEYRVIERKLLQLLRETTDLHHREARDVFPQVVEAIFPVDSKKPDDFNHTQIQASLNELVGSVKLLEGQKWTANDVPVKFIVGLLKYASDASAALAKPDASGGERTLKLPRSAARLVDEILADQMKHLGEGESYCVISDFVSWHNEQLRDFWKQTQLAVNDPKRLIHVRRVFCRLGGDNRLAVTDAKRMLETHWKEAEQAPIANGRPTYDVAVCLDDRWFPHYGVFQYRDNARVSFEPTPDTDLSEMRFSRAPDMAKFEECWQHSVKFATTDTSDPHNVRRISFSELLKLIDDNHAGWWSYFRGR